MDPLSQGVVGATVPLSFARRQWWVVGVLGLVSGMAPDLDVLIRSDDDPLLFLEYHRQFTHSLIFIPLGSFICALILFRAFAHRHLSFRQTWIWCTAGYATHGLLDTCTSYGTQLLWPFSTARFAWHNISIIDPLFTLPLLGFVVLAMWRSDQRWARLGCCWILAYLAIGVGQRERAEAAVSTLANARNHANVNVEAKPSFGNILLWKSIYLHDGRYYIDAVRAGREIHITKGESVARFDRERDLPWLDPNSQQARDIERFRWFSSGFLALSPEDPNTVVDVRYSMLPHRGEGLWGIVVSPNAATDVHVGYTVNRQMDGPTRRTFWAMLNGNDPAAASADGTRLCGHEEVSEPVPAICGRGELARPGGAR